MPPLIGGIFFEYRTQKAFNSYDKFFNNVS